VQEIAAVEPEVAGSGRGGDEGHTVHGSLGTAPSCRCHHALSHVFQGGVALFPIVLGVLIAQILEQGCECGDDMDCLATATRGQAQDLVRADDVGADKSSSGRMQSTRGPE